MNAWFFKALYAGLGAMVVALVALWLPWTWQWVYF